MRARYLFLLFFILLLPTTLYFTLSHHYPNASAKSIQDTASNRYHLAIQEWTTEQGTRVLFVETKEIPVVDVEISFDAGSARDGSKPGLAYLCAHLLSEGASGLTADAIAKQFEEIGVDYHAEVNRDRTILSLRSLPKPQWLDPAVALLSSLISTPDFLEENINTLKNRMARELQRHLQQPNVVAKNSFYQAIYSNHPYAHPTIGTEESLSTITQPDLVGFHQKFFVAKNAVITIVGGIDRAKAAQMAEQLSQKLVIGNSAEKLPDVGPLQASFQQHIPFPSEQTHILLGQPCLVEGDPDYFTLLVGNYILGGNPLTSRLFKDIRDKHGLAYYVGSMMLPLQRPGPFALTLQTKNAQAQEAIKLLKENLLRFLQEGPTAQEIAEAKKGMIRALPLELNTNHKIKAFVSALGFYKLPLNFLDTYTQHIEAITAKDVHTAFQKRIQPDQMALIVVGTP